MNIQSYRKEIQKLDDKMIVGGGGPWCMAQQCSCSSRGRGLFHNVIVSLRKQVLNNKYCDRISSKVANK